MGSALIGRLRWSAKGLYRRIGLAGVLGLALFVVSVLLYVSAHQATKARLEELEASAQTAQRDYRRAKLNPRPPVLTPAAELERFYRTFPQDARVPDLLDTVFGAAEANGVVLAQGQYKLTRESNARLNRYQLTLPVNGTYVQIRRFLTQLLNELPILSLDNVRLERETIAETALKAQIDLTLFLDERQ